MVCSQNFSSILIKLQNLQIYLKPNFSFSKIPNIHSAQCPKIPNIPFDSNRPKEPKSTLHFVKNLTIRPKSTKNNSDENALRSKLVQKSICKFLTCSTHSPHQNPIKIVLKFILELLKNSIFHSDPY